MRIQISALTCALSVLLSVANAEQATPDSSEATPHEQAAIELYTAPRPKNIDMESYPAGELDKEGWVELAFMVDTHGKPFEVTVIRSTGNAAFDKVAMRSIEHSSFEPGKLNGTPVESGYEMKYRFASPALEREPGANRGFIKAYKSLLAAVNAGDRTAADQAMQNLQVTNLYEDAYYGIALYNYAWKWGDESQQLEGLRRAIAEEDRARYLPPDLFRFALSHCMQLELNSREYAEAITTWKRLQKAGIDKDTAARAKPALDKLERIRTDDSTYAVSGLISDRNWYLHLFKRHFRAVVSAGYISEVRLRCDKRHVFFTFDSTLQYEVANKYGNCSIELVGAPGTRFELIQF